MFVVRVVAIEPVSTGVIMSLPSGLYLSFICDGRAQIAVKESCVQTKCFESCYLMRRYGDINVVRTRLPYVMGYLRERSANLCQVSSRFDVVHLVAVVGLCFRAADSRSSCKREPSQIEYEPHCVKLRGWR
jgi:hypothetical protein